MAKLLVRIAHGGIESVKTNDGQGEVEIELAAHPGITPPIWIGVWDNVTGDKLGEGHLRVTGNGLALVRYPD